ncbi:ankyrin repeat domain-containing protein [Leptospira kirschneri]|uniref:ankyrin repeat domain-containing protein n=1 Tax=Leptospira kirschneri TaxID=29507 RepID=UPI0009911548|nr:ankyrin repeat domain-containing protein [Leptospira kirschneri]
MESNLYNSRLLKEVEQSNPDISKIKNLLNEGANINCHSLNKGARNNWGNTPLHISVNNGNLEIVEKLINLGADVNSKNTEGDTPAFKIPWGRKEGLELLQLLHKHGANLFEKNNDQTSLLHYAALNNQISILEFLLEQGLDPNQGNLKNETPLYWTVHYNSLKCVSILLNAGSNINWKNSEGRTVLHEAAERDYQDLIQIFLQAGADKETIDNEEKKPIDLAEKEKTKNLLSGSISSNLDSLLLSMIQKLKADQKEFFESLPKEIQESLQSSLSKIDRVNFIKSTSKIFKKLKKHWETSFPEITTILFEWGGETQTPFNGYAYARGYEQFEPIGKGAFVFESEFLKFEDLENGIDFTDAFEGIDSILELCNSQEYWIVKKLYNLFLSILLNEVLTDIFSPESENFWFIFGSEHDQEPFLLYKS